MKNLILFIITCSYSISFAMTKQDFLKLDEKGKEDFINTQAIEVYKTDAIQDFIKNNPSIMPLILNQSKDLTSIWGDTILEGPYALNADPETTIQSLYTYNNEIFAILANIYASAVVTEGCEYDEDADQWGDDCDEGSISESFVIDTEGNLIDMGYYPEFDQ